MTDRSVPVCSCEPKKIPADGYLILCPECGGTKAIKPEPATAGAAPRSRLDEYLAVWGSHHTATTA